MYEECRSQTSKKTLWNFSPIIWTFQYQPKIDPSENINLKGCYAFCCGKRQLCSNHDRPLEGAETEGYTMCGDIMCCLITILEVSISGHIIVIMLLIIMLQPWERATASSTLTWRFVVSCQYLQIYKKFIFSFLSHTDLISPLATHVPSLHDILPPGQG